MTTLQPLLFLTPPRNPSAVFTTGSAGAISRDVTLVLSADDVVGGFANVTDMLIWGDGIDPNFRPEIFGVTEGASRWMPYEPTVALVLKSGEGQTKNIHVKLGNAAGYESDEMGMGVMLNSIHPHVSMLWSDQRRLLHEGGTMRFGWSASSDFTAWAVVLAPSTEAGRTDCVTLSSGGSGAAGSPYWAVLAVADIEAADFNPTQAGTKWIKVFIQVGGVWYSSV